MLHYIILCYTLFYNIAHYVLYYTSESSLCYILCDL